MTKLIHIHGRDIHPVTGRTVKKVDKYRALLKSAEKATGIGIEEITRPYYENGIPNKKHNGKTSSERVQDFVKKAVGYEVSKDEYCNPLEECLKTTTERKDLENLLREINAYLNSLPYKKKIQNFLVNLAERVDVHTRFGRNPTLNIKRNHGDADSICSEILGEILGKFLGCDIVEAKEKADITIHFDYTPSDFNPDNPDEFIIDHHTPNDEKQKKEGKNVLIIEDAVKIDPTGINGKAIYQPSAANLVNDLIKTYILKMGLSLLNTENYVTKEDISLLDLIANTALAGDNEVHVKLRNAKMSNEELRDLSERAMFISLASDLEKITGLSSVTLAKELFEYSSYETFKNEYTAKSIQRTDGEGMKARKVCEIMKRVDFIKNLTEDINKHTRSDVTVIFTDEPPFTDYKNLLGITTNKKLWQNAMTDALVEAKRAVGNLVSSQCSRYEEEYRRRQVIAAAMWNPNFELKDPQTKELILRGAYQISIRGRRPTDLKTTLKNDLVNKLYEINHTVQRTEKSWPWGGKDKLFEIGGYMIESQFERLLDILPGEKLVVSANKDSTKGYRIEKASDYLARMA